MIEKLYLLILIVATSLTLSCNNKVSDNYGSPAKNSTTAPNIVLIYADDMGYGEIEALNPGRSKVPTPHLNNLIKRGRTFDDAHTTSSVCTPSRYALLTGRYNWRSRLQQGVTTGDEEPLIAPDRLTLPEMLRKEGYSTAIVGKWHLEYRYNVPDSLQNVKASEKRKGFFPTNYPIGTKIVGGPITRGFDSFYGFHHSRVMSSLVRDDVIEKEINVIDILPNLTDEAVTVINEKASSSKDGKPFFLYFAQSSPHTPIAPSKEWQGRTDLGAYGDFVAQTDGSVGAILKAIDYNGLTDNTIVIFSSDNGTSRAANIKSLNSKGHYPSANYRGSKADAWEGGHRVPFIIRWPGLTQPNSSSKALICLSDIIATMAEYFQYELPDDAAEDSQSFLQAISGHNIPHQRESVVHHSINGRFAIRHQDWKLILAPGSGGWTAPNDVKATKDGLPPLQLYNLSEDIGESNNVQHLYPDKVKSMTTMLEKIVSDGRSTAGSIQANDVEIDIFKDALNFNKD